MQADAREEEEELAKAKSQQSVGAGHEEIKRWEDAFTRHLAPAPLHDAEARLSPITQTQRLTSGQEAANEEAMAANEGAAAAPVGAVTFVLSPDQIVPHSHYRPYEQEWPQVKPFPGVDEEEVVGPPDVKQRIDSGEIKLPQERRIARSTASTSAAAAASPAAAAQAAAAATEEELPHRCTFRSYKNEKKSEGGEEGAGPLASGL